MNERERELFDKTTTNGNEKNEKKSAANAASKDEENWMKTNK